MASCKRNNLQIILKILLISFKYRTYTQSILVSPGFYVGFGTWWVLPDLGWGSFQAKKFRAASFAGLAKFIYFSTVKQEFKWKNHGF